MAMGYRHHIRSGDRPTAPRHVPTLVPDVELSELMCAARSGHGVDAATTVRLLEHIAILGGILRTQAQRVADAAPAGASR